MKSSFIAHRAEMNDIIDFEWSEEEICEAFKADGWRAGREEGREEGRELTLLENIRNLMFSLNLSPQQAMDALKIDKAEQTELAERL